MSYTLTLLKYGIAAVMVSAVGGSPRAEHLDDGPPVVAWTRSPQIPSRAENTGTAGVVTLLVLVRKDGSVGPATVLDCEPRDMGYEASARQALREWGFTPARNQGEFVEAYTVVEIEFQAVRWARRARYRSQDWSYVSAANGGTYRDGQWNQTAERQRDQIEWRQFNQRHRVSSVWCSSAFVGGLPGDPWYCAARPGVLKSPVNIGAGYLPRPDRRYDETLLGPANVGDTYQRAAAGPRPVQFTQTPGLVRPMGFAPGASRTSGNHRSPSSSTRGTRSVPTRSSRSTRTSSMRQK